MQVLETLPPDWPIKTVKAFLLHSLRSNVHTFRMDRIEQNLARGENLQVIEARKIDQDNHNVLLYSLKTSLSNSKVVR